MGKQKLIATGVVAALAIGGLVYYFYFSKPKAPVGTEGVLDINTNPLKNAPDLNPVQKTNPYSNVKTNPFE